MFAKTVPRIVGIVRYQAIQERGIRFRTVLLASVVGLVIAMAVAVIIALNVVLDRSAQRDVHEQLRRTERVFLEMHRYRASILSAGARMLSESPRLVALLATTDITAITVEEVAVDLSRVFETERFLVVNADGRVLADLGVESRARGDTNDDVVAERPERADRMVRDALADGSASGMWIQGRHVYQVLAQRIGFADDPLGVVVVGYRFDERMTESVFRLTGSVVLMELDGQLMDSSVVVANGLGAAITSDALAVPTGASTPTELTLHGSKYLATAAHFGGTDRDDRLRYVVLRSLDRALAPRRQLQKLAYVAIGLALPLAFLVAFVIARRLSRPVDELVGVAERIGGGDLEARAEVHGAVEMRTLASAMNRMASGLDRSRKEVAEKERIAQEMAIAAQIQTSILPPAPLSAHRLEIAAQMIPATEVGGDYYDILPAGECCWLAIGDVADHGVPAGMIMMMVQNVVASITRARPDAIPSAVFCQVNRILVDNVRNRMKRDDHVTLTLLYHDGEGRLTFAGAHEDILVWRAARKTVETVETPGTWLAVMDEIDEFITDQDLLLEDGDIMVLYTDGITEGKDESGEQFGMDRLRQTIGDHAEDSAEALCAAIVTAAGDWTHEQDDDITVVVVRYQP